MTIPIEQMAVKWTNRTAVRTLDACMTDRVFNVKDFGAVGDSTNFLNGTDNVPFINAAIAVMAASAGSFTTAGTLYFPPGQYRVGSTVNFTGTGKSIVVAGESRNASAIGGSFPDMIFNDELSAFGCSLAGVSNMVINNSYRNFITSCSYAASGAASCLDVSVSGTTMTIHDSPGTCLNTTIADVGTSPVVHTMTLTSGVSGSFLVGQLVTGSGVTAGSIITADLGGSPHQYSLSVASTISGSRVDTTGIIGTFGIGQIIFGPSQLTIQANSIIAKVLSGTGGAGSTYQLTLPGTASNVAIQAVEGGVVTFTAMDSVTPMYSGGPNLEIGQYFLVSGMFPRAFNGRYVACTGTTGTTLVGGGNCRSTTTHPTPDPGPVTTLGVIGGGCIRMNNTNFDLIERCEMGAMNPLHLGGAFGYGNLGSNAYNTFGVTVRDCHIATGTNGDYGSVGAYVGQVNFWNTAITQFYTGIVVSSNGFGYHHGHLENNYIGIVLGRDDQGFGSAAGAGAITASHTEDAGIAVDVVSANQFYIGYNQWTGQHMPMGAHTGINFTGTTTSGTSTIAAITATVFTGDTTIHSPRITNVSSFANLYEGMAISGAGIPAGSTIHTMEQALHLFTFLNAVETGSPPTDTVGASATASTITITATLTGGMRANNIAGSTALAENCCIVSPSAVSGGTYSVTLNKPTTASQTATFNFNPTPISGMRFNTAGGLVLVANNSNISASVACHDLSNSNMSATFINNYAGGPTTGLIARTTGLGPGWIMPPALPSPGSVKYIGNDNPSSAFPYSSLPGGSGISEGIEYIIEGREQDITDCNTTTLGAVANAGGTGPSGHRKLRATGHFACTLARSGFTVTATCADNHGLPVDPTGAVKQHLIINGALEGYARDVSKGDYNGYFDCTINAVNTFTYTIATTPSTPATGTIVYYYWQVVG